MATTKVILKKEKIDSNGEAPLYLRIIKNRKAKFVSLGIKLKIEHWDEKKNRVKNAHPNSVRLNNFLSHKITESQDIILEMETDSKYVKPKQIKEAILGRTFESFLKYADQYLDSLSRRGKMGTHDKAKAVISKLKNYLNGKDLAFDELTVHFLKRYEEYLRFELENSTNTIHSNLKIFRKLMNDAINEDVFPYEKNPFLKYKLKWEKTEMVFLTEEELERFENVEVIEGSMKYHHKNMFVFACYAGGLRISDCLQLTWEQYDGERILLNTHKGNAIVSIKVPRKAKEILEIYRTDDTEKSNCIFPFLKKDVDSYNPTSLFKAISSATSYTNKDLKSLAEQAEINKSVNFHTSRHTWATRALRKGMRIEYVSRILGHSSIKTTQIYAKIVNEDLDKAMNVFDE